MLKSEKIYSERKLDNLNFAPFILTVNCMFPRAKLRRHLEKNKLGLKNNIITTDTYICPSSATKFLLQRSMTALAKTNNEKKKYSGSYLPVINLCL